MPDPGRRSRTSTRRASLASLAGNMRQARVVRLGRLADLPASAESDRAALEQAGVQALIAAPLTPGGQALGFWP